MKKILFFISSILLSGLSSTAFANAIESSMSCEVKHLHVTQVIEGKTKVYSGVQGEFEVGDKIRFELTYRPNLNTLTARFEDTQRDNLLVIKSIKGPFELSKSGSLYKFFDDGRADYVISPDYIRLDGALSRLFLGRYYKNDYHGYFTVDYLGEVQTRLATFDCRTENDRLDEIFAAIKKSK